MTCNELAFLVNLIMVMCQSRPAEVGCMTACVVLLWENCLGKTHSITLWILWEV